MKPADARSRPDVRIDLAAGARRHVTGVIVTGNRRHRNAKDSLL